MTTAAYPSMKPFAGGPRVEAHAARWRMGKSMTASVVFHALLFLLLLFTGSVGNEGGSLTEISWLDGDPGIPPSSAAPEVISQPVPSGSAPERSHFERKSEVGEIEPRPQAPALADRLEERLASLQRRESEGPAIAPLAVGLPRGSQLAGTPGSAGSGTGRSSSLSIGLRRQETRSTAPLELKRTEETPALPAAAVIAPRSAPPRAARQTETVTQRELAGATLLGPVANRKLLVHTAPIYPDWAKREGVEASVRLYFIVRADGGVQENIVVEKTSGYEEFDANALTALLSWKFEPLRDAVGDQWGQITFRFRLRDAGVE